MSASKNSENITVRMPLGTKARIDKLLGATRISNAEFMRRAILEKLAREEAK